MNQNPSSNLSRSRLVSLLMILILVLISASNSVAAPPTPGDEVFEAVNLPPEARSLPSDFITNLGASKNPKLDSAMADLAAAAEFSVKEAIDLAQSQLLRLSGNRVHVQIVTHARGVENVIEAVTEAGGEVTGVGNDDTLIQGWLPVDTLGAVAAQDDVYLIRRPTEIILLENLHVGNSTTEGLAVINGPAWHTAGYTGPGVKVAIIDGGFTGYTGLLGTDLPAAVVAKNFVDGESDAQVDGTTEHGTACAEIIHDIAPDAELYLVKMATNLDLAEAVAWVKNQGVDIISTSIGFYNAAPGDGTGEFADLVQDARDDGILWVTAAGNDREAHWGGLYADTDSDNYHEFNGKEINCFGPGDDTCYNINPGFQFIVYVRWNDWTNVNQDYDLHLVRWTGSGWSTIASSTNTQNGSAGQTPTEAAVGITSGEATAYGFVIERVDSTQNVNFEIFVPKFVRPDEILHARSISNLADAPGAITVAALDVTAPYPQESYSSEGPTNGPGGAETGGFTKPDISGFANVSTESYGSVEGSKFNGTSAATPHVAGAAALVLSANPSYTPDQLQSFLEGRAVDMGSSGKDTLYGYGRLHLGDPPSTAGAPTVTGITPASGVNTGTVHITNLAGTNFQSGTTVKLAKSGQSDIDATNVNVASETQITCDFDLTGAATGQWDVVVTNPDLQSGTLPNGFTVKAPGAGYFIYLPLVLKRHPPIPYVPVLRPISNPDGDGNYTVSWNPAGLADQYVLEEDDNASFSSPTTQYTGPGTSWNATGKDPGTYYYHVRASNSWGYSGWSNIQSVTVAPPGRFYAVEDTTVLKGAPDAKFGSASDMWVGYDHCAGGKISRSLIQFDLSSIPAATSISQATLYLQHMNSCYARDRSHTVTVYRAKDSWSSSSATWNNQPGSAEAYGSASVPVLAFDWHSFDVTDLVRGWVNGSFPNYGIVLRGPEGSGSGGARLGFATINWPGTSYDPYLIITYAGMATSEEAVPAVEEIPGLATCGPTVEDALGIFSSPSDFGVVKFVDQTVCSPD